MAEVSKLPEDGESVGVNQIRNKVNEIIDEGVGGGGGGNAVIDVGDVGVYSSNLSNNLFIEPAEGANNNGGLRNVSGTYIPNAGTNRIDDFPVHQQKISDSTGINHFAFILNGRLYTATGNEGHGNFASTRGDGDSTSENPGLENIREHNLGGYYQHDTDVEVLDFYIGYSFSAVLTSDGILWGWGRNNTGQLAQGNTTTYNSPVIIDRNVTRMWGPRGVQQHMGTWYDHGALYWQNSQDTYHQIRCAGYNGQGQLADGTTASTGTTAKPFVISSWSHLNDFVSYQVKQVYNFTGVYGFVFIVLQHKNDPRVQQVIACGYNGYSNLGIDRYDSHTSAGPSSNPHYAQSVYPEILPTNTVNVTKWLWCLTAEGIPSWLPSWRCWHDSCAQEILGFYAGYHHSITATSANIHPWAVCWSRVWSVYGEVQGDFLRAAGKNTWGMLGCVDKALGTTSHVNGQNYKTFKYIPPDTDGYTWDEALAAAPTSESGAKLAAPTTRAEWDRIGVYIAETLSQPNSQDMHHGWLALVDSEAEGWWKNYHTNKQTNRLYLPFSGVQPDDASGNQHFQGYTEFVYYNPQSVGVRTEDMTEFRYQGSGETDGIRADYYINNSTNIMGRGVHDSICVGRGNTTTNNYVFIADTHCTSTTTPTLKTRIWRSNSTTSKVAFSDVIDENKFSVTTEHPSCYSQNGYKLHYVNPYIGKFVHIEDTGDLLYIAWHHDNNQLICARTHNLGSNWTYHYSTIPEAWGQRTRDEGFYVGGAGIHADGGCTSAVYLGNGVVVAAFGGASTWSGLGIGENRPSQALLVRSYDYGKTWHMIGDGDVAWTFSNLTPVGNYATHFTVGRYYDTISNKFRLICSACSGGVVGNGNYLSSGGFGWSINSDVFAVAYSDNYGETWNWCEIDGAQINYDLMDITLWPNKDIFRGDMMHFIDQQSKVFIVRTHWEQAEEGNIHGATRANWDVKTNAWCYVSGDGGRTFASMPPGYLTNLTDYDAGIIQENGVYNKAGADLNNTGVPVQGTYMGKSYRSVIKLEAYGTDGVVVFWGRNSDQQYQAPGYGDSSTFDNNTVEVVNYKNLMIPAEMDSRWGIHQLNETITATSIVSDYAGNGSYWPYAWFGSSGTSGNFISLFPTDSYGNAPGTVQTDLDIGFDMRWSARVFAVDYDGSETQVGKIAFMVNGFNNQIWVRNKTTGEAVNRTIWVEGPSSSNIQAGFFRLEYECEIYAIDKTNWNTVIRPEIVDSTGTYHIPGGDNASSSARIQQVPASWKQWNKIPRWEFVRDNFSGDPFTNLQQNYPWAYELITQWSDRIVARDYGDSDWWQTRDITWKRIYPGNLIGNFSGANFYYTGDINDLSWQTLAYYPGTTRNIDEIDDDPFMNISTKISDTPPNQDDPMQPEHRITAIYDIMNPDIVRNGPNVADYFMGPYHYSWGNNATYKQLFNQGSHLTGSYLPTGDLSFMQGGYGNLNSGNTIFAYAKKFPGTWLGFSDGENYAHIMAGSFVGYDGWRDLSSANKVSGNNFIFQAGGALYPQLNDIGGPSTTRSWGDYNGSTRYYGFWIEKEYAAADDNGTITLGRDGLNKNPCISIAIPEINRFTSPNSCTEYTNLVQDPVIQIRDIRQYSSGPGGLIITLSNGNAWSIGYNGVGQRCAADYLNLGTTTTNYDFPTKIIYPNKQNNSQGWDNCLIATSSWATYDHHNSIIMRDKQGSAWGWGDNNVGELGLGYEANQYGPPEKIPLPKGVVPSVMGCAGSGSRGPVGIMITDDGRMFAAGYNGNNLVANGEGAVSNFRLYIPIRNPLA